MATSARRRDHHYAQEQLGDVVYVELPEVGKVLSKGDEAAVIESVKAAAELYAPVDCEIVETNERAGGKPGAGQPDPEGAAGSSRSRSPTPSAARRSDGRRRLCQVRGGAGLMRYLPLTHADRQAMLAKIGVPSIDALFADIAGGGAAGEPAGPAAAGGRAGGRAGPVGARGPERGRRRRAVLRRLRRLQAPRARERRSSDPALGVPDRLYALSARGVPGHAAVSVRVPDPGGAAHGHGGGERLHV